MSCIFHMISLLYQSSTEVTYLWRQPSAHIITLNNLILWRSVIYRILLQNCFRRHIRFQACAIYAYILRPCCRANYTRSRHKRRRQPKALQRHSTYTRIRWLMCSCVNSFGWMVHSSRLIVFTSITDFCKSLERLVGLFKRFREFPHVVEWFYVLTFFSLCLYLAFRAQGTLVF